MINENLGYAVGENGAIYKYDASSTGIEETKLKIVEKFELNQNYPNPFNSKTVISYMLKAQSMVDLRVYNLLGQEVRRLVEDTKPAEVYSISWDGRNNKGEELPSGVYIYRLKAGDFVKSRKMVLLR